MREAMNTWKNLNPEYDHVYMDDQQAAKFILEEFGEDWYKKFMSLPVGVMRGDLWRYMIIYARGGVYADLDTECLLPISTWMKKGAKMIVCPETKTDFCQWTFAATKKHPVIKSVLEQIWEKLENPNYDEPHFVHTHTGPTVWSYGIKKALKIDYSLDIVDDFEKINNSKKAKWYKFHCYGGEDWRIFHSNAVHHIYGSQRWKEGYVRWIENDLVQKYWNY